ncbi:hypothetical protein KCU93_g409, partial [Aureobasidium melanogenum]
MQTLTISVTIRYRRGISLTPAMSNSTLALCQSIGSTAMRLFRSAPTVPTSAKFALVSIASCSIRPCTWHSATRSFSCLNRLRQTAVRSAEEEQRLARVRERFRQRYVNDPVFRQCKLDASKKSRRQPDIRAKINAHQRARNEANPGKCVEASSLAWAEDLSRRRANQLANFLLRGAAERSTWRTHAPIRYTDRVDHHCTSCNRNRFLRKWWKEKPEAPRNSEQPNPDRYMCNHCFANDWPRVVPETYKGKLPAIFRSPEFPLYKAHQEKGAQDNSDKESKAQKNAQSSSTLAQKFHWSQPSHISVFARHNVLSKQKRIE